MMKKLFAMLLALCLMMPAALAEIDEDGDLAVSLPGMSFFFTPPEDVFVLGREMSASAYNAVGLSQREIVAWMEEYDVWALLIDAAGTCEVHVLAFESWGGDYDDMSEYGLEMECGNIRYEYTDQGYDVLACDVYAAPEGHTFVRTEATIDFGDGTGDHLVEYLTVRGGYVVSVYLFTYEAEITPAQWALAESIVDSLWITPAQ